MKNWDVQFSDSTFENGIQNQQNQKQDVKILEILYFILFNEITNLKKFKRNHYGNVYLKQLLRLNDVFYGVKDQF